MKNLRAQINMILGGFLGAAIFMSLGAVPAVQGMAHDVLALWQDSSGVVKATSTVNIETNDAGVSANANSDDLVIENNTHMGMSFLTSGSTAVQEISFGDAAHTNIGRVKYTHSSNTLSLGANGGDQFYLTSSNLNMDTPIRHKRITGTTPAEPFACGASTVAATVYVDDTDDGGIAYFCVCLDLDDGSTFDWRRMDDHTAACASF